MNKGLLVAALITLAPHCITAQPWSAEQQQVIQALEHCNDAWVQSFAKQDIAVFTTMCPQFAGALFWYTGGEAPITYDGPTGMWNSNLGRIKTYAWEALRPVGVFVEGDIALIHFYVTWVVEPINGAAARNESKRLTVFQREGGIWRMAGGSVAAAQ